MISLEESLNIIRSISFGKTPKEYVEYSNGFVFFMNGSNAFDGGLFVDKVDGLVSKYNPALISPNELGKKKINKVK